MSKKKNGLSAKHSAFVEAYLELWNQTQAYQRVYPKSSAAAARANAARLIANDSIAAEIAARLAERAMSANEVLDRLAAHARGDIGDLLQVSPSGETSLNVQPGENTRLIKKVTQRRTTRTTEHASIEETVLSVELHDAQSALALIGRHHRLFAERIEHTGKDGKDLNTQTQVNIYLPDNGRNGDRRDH